MKENNEIVEIVDKITCRTDFEFFLQKLKENFGKNKEDWENDTLESYLEGLYGYNYESENDQPTWKLFAEILLAARVFE
ncbi:hypothetical protein [Flavobacterium sp. GT3R68]|uniref:DUF7660 family protein n=1 Tax=Flavobacterium sp. GT3R68 TaxID=2594437 RepID=UPI001184AE56|nr:hypothetical protein [Flavobacterium sp. GT3R68]TRW88635.1 hypothetical protein FNW07_13660 [Flavobacterium sp. GT3R68]